MGRKRSLERKKPSKKEKIEEKKEYYHDPIEIDKTIDKTMIDKAIDETIDKTMIDKAIDETIDKAMMEEMEMEEMEMEIEEKEMEEKEIPRIVRSKEQSEVVESFIAGNNLIVSAVAGAGKSTTVFEMAREVPNKYIIQLTYNSQLKEEIREKARKQGIENVEAHTYHSLSVKYYNEMAHEDMMMRRVVYGNTRPRSKMPQVDVVVIDESQDATLLYYMLVYKFIRDSGRDVQIVVLGDVHQGIYSFKGADTRFLTLAKEIWKHHPNIKGEYRNHILSTSYRITEQIAWFINDAMLGEERMNAPKQGPKVVYIRNNKLNAQRSILYHIVNLLDSGEIKPDDVFILGGSVKGEKSHIRQLENKLVTHGIPCFVPTNENAELNQNVIEGKLIFSTFHQSKGREKEVVVIMGFDKSYFDYYNRRADPEKCPSTLYVGASRAKKLLILVENAEDHRSKPLPFLRKTHKEMKQIQEYIDFNGHPYNSVYSEEEGEESAQKRDRMHKHIETVTNIIRFMDEEILSQISEWLPELFTVEIAPSAETTVEIPSIVSTLMGFKEEISDLNGKVIPMLYEIEHQGSCTIKGEIDRYVEESREKNKHEFLQKAAEKIVYPCNDLSEYLYMLNVYKAFQEGLYFKVKQLDMGDYHWLTNEMVKKCHQNMDKNMSNVVCYEKTIVSNQDNDEIYKEIDRFVEERIGFDIGKIRITGRVDAVDIEYNTVWEFKCVKEITMDHMLQLLLYAWLWKMTSRCGLGPSEVDDPEFKIMNIRTGEIRTLNTSSPLVDNVVEAIFRNKYRERPEKTDEEFMELCMSSTERFR